MEETPNSEGQATPITENVQLQQNPPSKVSINHENEQIVGTDENYKQEKHVSLPRFERTGGAAGIEGQRCEMNLVILVLLKAKTDADVEKFFLASNFQNADKFDDLVFKYERKKKSKIVFLQAKHKTGDAKDVNVKSVFSDSLKADFPLPKYFISYRKIKQHFLESKGFTDPIFSEDFDNSEFLIYTNASFQHEDRKGIKEFEMEKDDLLHVTDSKGKFFQFEINTISKIDETIFDLLKNLSESQRLAKILAEGLYSGDGINLKKDIIKSYHKALQTKLIEPENEQTNEQDTINKKTKKKYFSSIMGKLLT